MKYFIPFLLFAIEAVVAYCPDCDISSHTTFEFSPSVIDNNGQTVTLTATVNCPKDTWFHSFTGYTIDWDDKNDSSPDPVLYDKVLSDYRKCISEKNAACGNVENSDYRNQLTATKTFTRTHTYKDKESHHLKISFTLLQNKNTYSSSACGSSHATVATKEKRLSTTINATPMSYCAIPKGYVLFATENISINDRVACPDKEKSSVVCKVGAENNITVGVKGFVDEIHANGNAILRNYSKVSTGVWAKTIEAQNGAEYARKGNSTNFLYNKSIDSIAFANISEFIENGKIKTYEPGIYGDVSIRRDGTLVLKSAGVYFFKSLRFEPGSILKLNSTNNTELYTQEFNFSGAVIGAKAANFLVGVLGSTGTYVDNGFTGSIWAPRSRMVIGQFHHKTFNGSFMAKELFVPQDTKVNYVQFNKNGACK